MTHFQKLLVFLLAMALFRFFYSGLTELTPDEAYYWEWSRHLELSYYDHPPMVAYLIFLSTWVGGAYSEEWVRFQGVLVGIGISLLAYFLARDLFKSEKTGLFAAVFINLCLLISVGCFIITPDTPQGIFGAATLYFFYRGTVSGRAMWWFLSGASLGLCMLSKYTAVLLIPCILMTLATWPDYRKWLLRKEFFLAAITAFIVSLPVLIWNIQNNLVSFSLQGKHGFFGMGVNPLVGFFDFIGTQFGLLTPFIFLSVIAAMIYSFLHRKEDFRYHFIFWNSAPILLFFCLLSFRQKIEGNWASLAYFVSLAGAVGIYFELKDSEPGKLKARWISFLKWSSVTTSIFIVGFVHIHAVYPLVSLKKSLDVTRRLHGWTDVGKKADEVLAEMNSGPQKPFVFGSRHQIISELSFYMKDNPQTYKVGGKERYPYIKVGHLKGQDAVYVEEKHRNQMHRIKKYFERVEPPVTVTIERANRVIWEFVIIKCYDYKGGLINV